MSVNDQFAMNMLKSDINLIKQELKSAKLESISKLELTMKDVTNDVKFIK